MVQFFDPTQEAEIKRRRKMAEALQAQAAPQQTQVVSGYAVPQSGLEALAKGLSGGYGAYQGARADSMEEDLAASRQKMAEALMKSTTRAEAASIMGQDPSMIAEALKMKFPDSADLPSAVEEYNFYKNLPASEQPEFLKVKRTNPFLDVGGQLIQPNPATGAPLVTFDKTATPKDAAKSEQTMLKEQRAALAAIGENAQTTKKIQEVLDNASGLAGITGLSSYIPNRAGSKSADAQADIDTIKARSAFGGLQEMRMNSPTGGALGGIAVQELEMLKNAEASLQNAQSQEEFTKSLNEYKMALQNADKAIKDAYFGRYGEELPLGSPTQPDVADPLAGARAAIAAGADPAAVKRRLQENGIATDGL